MKNNTNKLIYFEEYIPINGISQYLFHCGTDYKNPVLLILHGGPGSAESIFSYTFQEKWENIFTVVHWDQRGAGKTLTENPDEDTFPTTEILLNDLKEICDYLKKKYNKKKIILLSHSWGSILGSLYIQSHPEDIEYYIGVGQVVDMLENEKVAYDKTKEAILKANNKHDLKKLNSLGEYPGEKLDLTSTKTIRKFRKIQAKYNLAININFSLIKNFVKSPIFQLSDVKAYLNSYNANKSIYKFLENFTLYSKPLKYEVPIFYILGDNDWQTPYNIASKYFNKIDAPYKKLYVIPNAGHMTMMDEPELFFEALSDINTNSLIKK